MASSASGSAPKHSLAFGLEMELLIRPKEDTKHDLAKLGWDQNVGPSHEDEGLKSKNRYFVHTLVAEDITRSGVGASTVTNNYSDWTVEDETALGETDDYWRVEIISRTLTTTENWQDEVDRVFNAFDKKWEIRLTKGCCMHIHVSPGRTTRYVPKQLQGIVIGIGVFDDAITKVMPKERKNIGWAVSNVHYSNDYKKKYEQVSDKTWVPFFNYVRKLSFPNMFHLTMGSTRNLSWNFSNVTHTCGTVEFRRPPGVKSAAEAKHWAGFTLGFVSEAISHDYEHFKSRKDDASVGELQSFISTGLAALGEQCKDSIDTKTLVEDTSTPDIYDTVELLELEKKKKNKESTYVKKVCDTT
ncbi:hypothetical protein F5B20DRAFT_578309 [Whalleya microplaca]|nr:hypothetical protein F5B20DRAFT_578309 [Whalleya microplaca]